MIQPDEIATLADAVAKSPAAVFEVINAIATRRVAAGLVTVMRHIEAEQTVERLYSSVPSAYPVGGRKLKRDSAWSRHVLVEHRVLVSAGDEALKEHYVDHATITGLGLHSCVNVPLVSQGHCVGTMNVCAPQTDWSAEDLAVVRMLGLAALAGVLAFNA